MQKNAGLLKLNEEDYPLREQQIDLTCGGCGRTVQKPILATVSSSNHVQTYYACPRCMTKVSNLRIQKSEEDKATKIPIEDYRKLAAKPESNVKCNHFLGYLKKRPKDSSIPDECLTCSKMIECLIR